MARGLPSDPGVTRRESAATDSRDHGSLRSRSTMFAQPYGALPPVPTPRPGDDDDVWHVAISYDDVKVMSVDQLDDAFRLDIITSDTMVWQKGMTGWQRLGVVAGLGADIDDDDDDQEDVLTVADVEVEWPPFPAPAKSTPIV